MLKLSAAERAWREALRFTTARADREFLLSRLAVCTALGKGECALKDFEHVQAMTSQAPPDHEQKEDSP
jgi:hypothetical protein